MKMKKEKIEKRLNKLELDKMDLMGAVRDLRHDFNGLKKEQPEPEPPALHLEISEGDLCIKFGLAFLGDIERGGKCTFMGDCENWWEVWRYAGFPVEEKDFIAWQGWDWWIDDSGILTGRNSVNRKIYNIFDFRNIHAYKIEPDNGFIQTYPNGRVRFQ